MRSIAVIPASGKAVVFSVTMRSALTRLRARLAKASPILELWRAVSQNRTSLPHLWVASSF